MNNSPFSDENTPPPNPTPELAQNQISGKLVLQPPTQPEMLSESKVEQPEPSLVPTATPVEPTTPVPTEPTKDYRPVWAQDIPAQDPVANITPQYKTGLPDGIYFLAMLMFVPLLIILQSLYVGLDYQSISSSSVTTTQLSSLFKDFTASLSSIATLTMGISAILLIFTRLKIVRFVAMIGLGLYFLAKLISFIESADTFFSLFSNSKAGQVLLIDMIVLGLVLPLLGIIYLCRSSVRASYDN
ncbi:hypothetical protein FWC31_03345 [Candidatus Saccharibacteria bacterium]|nr:hypothetical protein [Candidatus Saccharibacteria bacterium]